MIEFVILSDRIIQIVYKLPLQELRNSHERERSNDLARKNLHCYKQGCGVGVKESELGKFPTMESESKSESEFLRK